MADRIWLRTIEGGSRRPEDQIIGNIRKGFQVIEDEIKFINPAKDKGWAEGDRKDFQALGILV